MKLSFRGHGYDFTAPCVELSHQEVTTQYRGHSIKVQHTSKSGFVHPQQPLQYRGIPF
ncbi:MAG: DUF4278 domain-containing protein [Cyanobacteriota bacterium]|nr:DUF4278 domain-containing protein [Cyanobacteriota bacterium]